MKEEKIKKLEQIKNLNGLPLNYQKITIKSISLSEVPKFKVAKIDFYQSEKVYLKNLEKPISKLFCLDNVE